MQSVFWVWIRRVPQSVWVLAALIIVGAFLRTYHLHEWLKFRDDQARDAALVSQVVTGERPWPLMGAYMSYSGDGDHNEAHSFHLGPIYYYFQITAATLFGNYADKLAYPDVLCGILSIPLLFVFLRTIFERNLSLGITGLYAVSAYFIQYSRFAWNTNPIPFFVLLFLLALYQLLLRGKQVPWRWVMALGIALGVGVQLHVILLAVFSIMTVGALIFSLRQHPGAWRQWAIVCALALLINTSQIISEVWSGFSNTKILLNSSSRDQSLGASKFTLLRNDIDCHVEANAYFLSSYGSSNCTYEFFDPSVYGRIRMATFSKLFRDVSDRLAMLMAILFAMTGYILFIRSSLTESEKNKRYFFRLTLVYSVVVFLVMVLSSS